MDIFNELKKPLDIKDIDFRIQSVNKGWYATILVYKDARVDMNRLDEVVWAWYWKREHFDNNTRCKVSIYNKEIKEWISKEDVWTASNTEKEKGLASDSFKRACFNWGIGRELYNFPKIQVKLNSNEFIVKWEKAYTTFDFKLDEWRWKFVQENWEIKALAWKDQNGNLRFTYWDINLLKT